MKNGNNLHLYPTNGNIIEAFWEEASIGNLGFYKNLDDEKAALTELSETISNLIGSQNDEIEAATETVKNIDLQMPDYFEDPQVAILAAQKKEIYASQIMPAAETLGAVVAEIQNDEASEADIVKSLNDEAPDNKLYQVNEKIVNDIYLNTYAKGIPEFTSEQLDILVEIAHQCPLAGGKGVYLARSLVSPWYLGEYDDDTSCEQLEEEMRSAQQSDQMAMKSNMSEISHKDNESLVIQFGVYPNPATNEFNVTYSIAGENTSYLRITNSLGQVFYQTTLGVGTGQLKLSTEQFSAGLYIITLQNQKGKAYYRTKLTIIK